MTTTTATTASPAPYRTIAARFAGICRRCNGPITVGQSIRYGGKGRTYHLAADCPKGTGPDTDTDSDLSEATYPRLPELAPRQAGEDAQTYGLRALLFVTAERLTVTVDTEGLELARHCYRVAVSNPALTSTGAERLADVGRMISGALARRQAEDAPQDAPSAPQGTPAGVDRPNLGPGAPLAPTPAPKPAPAGRQPVAAPPTPAAPPVRLAPITAPQLAGELF